MHSEGCKKCSTAIEMGHDDCSSISTPLCNKIIELVSHIKKDERKKMLSRMAERGYSEEALERIIRERGGSPEEMKALNDMQREGTLIRESIIRGIVAGVATVCVRDNYPLNVLASDIIVGYEEAVKEMVMGSVAGLMFPHECTKRAEPDPNLS